MYLNRRSCTASKAQLQSEKEKGGTGEESGRKEETLGGVELLPCLFGRALDGLQAFLLPYHQDNYEVVARVVSLLCTVKTTKGERRCSLKNS